MMNMEDMDITSIPVFFWYYLFCLRNWETKNAKHESFILLIWIVTGTVWFRNKQLFPDPQGVLVVTMAVVA